MVLLPLQAGQNRLVVLMSRLYGSHNYDTQNTPGVSSQQQNHN